MKRIYSPVVAVAILVCSLGAQELNPGAHWETIALSEYHVSPNVVYRKVAGLELKLDVITPWAKGDPRPTVIFIHGGGWGGSSKEEHFIFPLPYLARGMDVVNVEYRFTSVARAPASVEDCRCALYWVYRNAKQYGFDTSKLIVVGESAGGHLTLMTGMLNPEAGFDYECGELPGGIAPKVSAIVAICAISNVNDLLEGPHKASFAVEWIGNQPNRAELARRVSPTTYVRRDLPPIVLVHGDKDPTVPYEQSVRLQRLLNGVGVPSELVTLPGAGHWFWPREQHLRAQAEIFKFLEEHNVLIPGSAGDAPKGR
jgi:acetyl esterase/lipase